MPEGAQCDGVRCDASGLWQELGNKMIEFLDSISLKTLVDEQRASGVAVDDAPVRRGISREPVVKPIRTSAPNSVFALGTAFLKQPEPS